MIKKFKTLTMLLLLVWMLGVCAIAGASRAPKLKLAAEYQKLPVLCYHNVIKSDRKDAAEMLRKDPYTMTAGRLEEHFKYLKDNGYTAITMQQYKDYVENNKPLPSKPIMITFDDGNDSMYTVIYPILKKYNFPALYSIIFSFMEQAPNPALIEKMVSWEQLKEMEDSGLVTVASHTYALHNFVNNNAYGDRFQNATTIWWNDKQTFEKESDFVERIDADFMQSKNILEKHLGHSSNVITWPYGAYNLKNVEIAKKYGYEYNMLLNDDVKNKDPHMVSRFVIYGNPPVSEIQKFLGHKAVNAAPKFGQLDIDMIYDPMPEQFERNIDAAIARLSEQGVRHVFLQAFNDADGSGNINSVYFYNTLLPIKADVFSHVLSKLKQGGFDRVFAWMPLLGYDVENAGLQTVVAEPEKNLGWYKRLSPFDPKTKDFVKKLAHDLALYTPVDGILFQDDLYLNDFEDFSPAAKLAFERKFNKELTKENLEDAKLRQEWTRYKTETLNEITRIAINEAKQYRPELLTARNIYSALLENPNSEEWFAQNYKDFLANYDYVVVMVYPEMEKADNAAAWVEKVTTLALKEKGAEDKVVFKLQTFDWNENKWLSDSTIWDREKIILAKKGKMIGYYPTNAFFKH